MPARLALVLVLAAAMAVLVAVTSATGAPIARTTTLLSKPTGVADPNSGDIDMKAASADGSRVFLQTDQRLTSDDNDSGRDDIYERAGGVTTLLSAPTGIADPDTASVFFDGASADGSRVFLETDQRLTSDDNDSGRIDIYERKAGTTTLVSGPTGVPAPDLGDASFRGVSKDGSHVFFESGEKLSSDDGDSSFVDVYDHSGGVTTLVSQPTGVADPDNFGATFGGASADGTRVFFDSQQKLTTDDGDTNQEDVYERSGATTTLISQPTGLADPDSGNASFRGASSDGSRVFFQSPQKLTGDDGDTSQTDIYQRAAGTTALVSGPTGVVDPDSGGVFLDAVSDDGSRVFLETNQKLTNDDGDSDQTDIYEHAGGTTTLMSGPTGVADPDSSGPDFKGISADGGHVFFETHEKLVSGDSDSDRVDAYEHSGGATKRVSAPTGVAESDDDADFGGWSADGSRVFFKTDQKMATGDGDGHTDVYERADGVTTFVSKETGVPETDTDAVVFEGASKDGSRVFFTTAQKLSPDDNDSSHDDVYAALPSPATTVPSTGGGSAAATPQGTLSPSALLLPEKANLGGVKKTIKVARNRRFKLGFRATPGLTGKASFKSIRKVRVSKRRKITLARKSFTVPGGGKVTLRVRLSRKSFRILERNRKIKVRLKVTVKNSAGATSTARKTITLKAPKRRRR